MFELLGSLLGCIYFLIKFSGLAGNLIGLQTTTIFANDSLKILCDEIENTVIASYPGRLDYFVTLFWVMEYIKES
jgi:hypothetical protein